MSDSIHHPHDKLIIQILTDLEEAASFLEAYLPENLSQKIDWNTLTLVKGSFIDEEYQDSASDLLYLVQEMESEEPFFLYVLLEHQSKPDKWMRFRFLKYMCRIWDESFKTFPKQQELVPIIPLVFYQGQYSWNYSTQFRELFRKSARQLHFIPGFTHFLVDQSQYKSEEVKGALKARIAQLLMLAAYHEVMDELLGILPQLLAQLPLTGGLNYLVIFVRYLADTQPPEQVEKLIELTRNISADVGGEMLTARQAWTLEGELKGKLEGKIETVESFLKAGVSWDVISHATGITQEKLQELKQKWQEMVTSSVSNRGTPSFPQG